MFHSRHTPPPIPTPAESAVMVSARRAARMRRIGVGVLIAAVTLLACALAVAIWGPVYGRYGWRVVSIAALLMEAILLAVLIEGLRPQNPYRHLDPRFSFLDRAPLTMHMQQNADTSDLWYIVPGLVASVLLLLSLAAV